MSAAQATPWGVAGIRTVNSAAPWSPRAFRAARSSSDSAVWLATTRTFALSAIHSLLRSWWSVPLRLVGRVVGVPVAQRPEGLPELALGLLVVERLVDVRYPERVAGGRQLLDLAGQRLQLRAHGDGQAVQLLERLLAHHHHDPRLDHGELVEDARLA